MLDLSRKHDRATELRAIADGRLLLNVRNGVTVSRSMLAKIADELEAERDALAKARRERDEARSIVRDIHWMAVRYADNRRSYAVGMCNDALRKAYDGGWLVYSDDKQHDLDPQYARDGMFDTEWRSAVDAANSRALEAEAQRDEALKALEPFALVAEHDIGEDETDDDIFWPISNARYSMSGRLRVGHLRAARRALAGGQEE